MLLAQPRKRRLLRPPRVRLAHHPPTHENLPAIAAPILEKIRRGEFINFDCLLPNNVPSESSHTYTMSLDQSDTSAGPRIVVHNTASNRPISVFIF